MTLIYAGFITFIFSFFFFTGISHAYGYQGVMGFWNSEDGAAKIHIYDCGDGLVCGDVVSFHTSSDFGDGLDAMNPDESLRTRSIEGITILKNFKMTAKNRWTRGTIYNPRNGNTYHCILKISVDQSVLRIRGFMGFSWIGSTTIWTRVVQ